MKLRPTIAGCLFLLLPVGVSAAPPAPADASADSARSFVQAFYAWYVPKILSPDGGGDSDIALTQKRAYFASPLAKALVGDAAAAAKSPDEIVGIDFDPYLNSQDPCDRYSVGAVTRDGDSYTAEVFGSCSSDERKDKPDVVAVVMRQGKSWVFTNFVYPGDGDLMSILKGLKQDRDKTTK